MPDEIWRQDSQPAGHLSDVVVMGPQGLTQVIALNQMDQNRRGIVEGAVQPWNVSRTQSQNRIDFKTANSEEVFHANVRHPSEKVPGSEGWGPGEWLETPHSLWSRNLGMLRGQIRMLADHKAALAQWVANIAQAANLLSSHASLFGTTSVGRECIGPLNTEDQVLLTRLAEYRVGLSEALDFLKVMERDLRRKTGAKEDAGVAEAGTDVREVDEIPRDVNPVDVPEEGASPAELQAYLRALRKLIEYKCKLLADSTPTDMMIDLLSAEMECASEKQLLEGPTTGNVDLGTLDEKRKFLGALSAVLLSLVVGFPQSRLQSDRAACRSALECIDKAIR